MATKKGVELIKLVSSANTGYFLIKKKPAKYKKVLKFNKYDPIARKHVEFCEKKNS